MKIEVMLDKVKVPDEGTFKCVLLSDGQITVFRAGPGTFHRDVAKYCKMRERELNDFYVQGGGRVQIENGILNVYGYSIDYGHMDSAVLEDLLLEYCKENNLEFINESGEGY